MIKTKGDFIRKAESCVPMDCVIEKTIRLSSAEYKRFTTRLLRDYDFIKENTNLTGHDENGVIHCLLVTGEGHKDAVLVNSDGYSYARHTALVPDVSLLTSDALAGHVERMQNMADFIAARLNQNEPETEINLEDIDFEFDCNLALNDEILSVIENLLMERLDVTDISIDFDRGTMTLFSSGTHEFTDNILKENYSKLLEIAPEFINGEEEYTVLTSACDVTRLIELASNEASPDPRFILTQTVQSGGHRPITDIVMEIKTDPVNETAEAVSFWSEGMSEPKTNGEGAENDLNNFLSGWLDDIKVTGFERMEPKQPEEMGMRLE